MNREPLEPVTEDDLAAYRRDGAVALRRVFDADWIDLLARGVARNLAEPGPYVRRYTAEDEPGLFIGDYCNWQRIEAYRRFAFDSPAPGLGARLMGSAKVNLFHEHVLVKEAATANRTPWHHDQPYWTVDGEQVCSIWVPLDPLPRETCVEFVAGSHRWGKWYTPKRFNDLTDHDTDEGESLPDRHSGQNHPLRPGPGARRLHRVPRARGARRAGQPFESQPAARAVTAPDRRRRPIRAPRRLHVAAVPRGHARARRSHGLRHLPRRLAARLAGRRLQANHALQHWPS